MAAYTSPRQRWCDGPNCWRDATTEVHQHRETGQAPALVGIYCAGHAEARVAELNLDPKEG